jgi:hypothetical protein
MKVSSWSVIIVLLSACSNEVVVHPPYQKQAIKITRCKPVVQYQGSSFTASGIDIPIPYLGGSTKVGDLSYKPQTLNTLYKEVAILDALRLQYCDARLAAAQISLAAFEAANNRMLDQEEKIAALALSATHGESEVKKTLDTVSNGPAPAPKSAAAQKVDNTAVAAAKEKAAAAPLATSSAAAAPSPTPSALAPALPPQVAAVVKKVPKKTLLRTARTKAPRTKPAATMQH